MLKTALKNLRFHKLRMAMTIMAIMLGVSFVAGTYFFTDTISKTFDNLFADVYSGVDLTVRPSSDDLGVSQIAFDESIAEIVANTDGVAVAAESAVGYAQFIGKDGEPIGGQGPPNLGFTWEEDGSLNPLQIQEGDGRAPAAPGEVVMDKATADNNGFAVGDTVQILSAAPIEEFELVGIATFGDAESLAGATIAAFELSEAQRLFNLEGRLSNIDIRVEEGVDVEQVKLALEERLPDSLELVTGEQQVNEDLDEFASGLGFIQTALLVFAGIAIFVGAFIIQNTFRIIVAQRTRELALLRALGASKAQIARLVTYEALAVSVIASTLGIGLGLGIAKGIQVLMNAAGFGIPPGPLVMNIRTFIVAYVVGIGVTYASSRIPARKASKLAPIEALRESQAPVKRRALIKRGIAGLLLLVGGGLLLIASYTQEDASTGLSMVGAGVAAQFIGVSVLAPLLARPFANTIGVLIGKLRGLPARLAYRNAARSPRRTASTASALMIGVSLVTLVSIMATSFKGAIDEILEESFAADVTILSNNSGEAGPGSAGFSSRVIDELRGVSELDEVSGLRYAFEGFEVKGDNAVFVIAGIEPDTFGNVIARLEPSDNAYQNLGRNKVVVRQDKLEQMGKQIGEQIEIRYAKTGVVNYEIVGSFVDPFDSDYLISEDDYLANFVNDSYVFIGATYASDTDPAVAKAAVETALEAYPQLSVQDISDLKQTANDQIDQVIGLLWGLLGMAVIIAVFGITNTLVLSISERTREIGLLRAVGMTRSQLRSVIRYESIIIALFGAALGLVMGIFFAWALINALEGEGIERMIISIPQLAFYLVFAVIAGMLAAVWPARKAAKMDVLKAISYE